MDRAKQAAETMQDLGVEAGDLEEQFPEFAMVKNRLIYGQIWREGQLDEKTRLLVNIACLTTMEGDDLANVLRAALGKNMEPVELQEVFHQVAPYIGFAKAQKGLGVLGGVLKEAGVELPLDAQATVSEQNRLQQGIDAQKSLFGPHIDAMRDNAPDNQKSLQDYLSAYCFGDTYTRKGLDLRTRELLTFVSIICLGGCQPQAKAHAGANLGAGNDEDVLMGAIVQCLPNIGFPKTLNAVAAVIEAAGSRNA